MRNQDDRRSEIAQRALDNLTMLDLLCLVHGVDSWGDLANQVAAFVRDFEDLDDLEADVARRIEAPSPNYDAKSLRADIASAMGIAPEHLLDPGAAQRPKGK